MSAAPSKPRDAWKLLVAGNLRFVAGSPEHPNQDAVHRDTVAQGQKPYAALFGCSDSRLGAEMIFDAGLGDLFVVRNIGQTISPSVIGSLEYAVSVLNVRLILVLAHDNCGAVKASIDSLRPSATPLPPNIKAVTDTIHPAINRVMANHATTNIADIGVEEVGEEHLRDTIGELLATSELIAESIADGRIAIVGATYNLKEGRVVPSVVIGDID
jgi:carbonic anhydrase